MILHCEPERIFPQAHLLNNSIVRGPGFHFQIVAQLIDCLVMCAVHFFETMRGAPRTAQRLNVAMLLLGQIMSSDVELQRAAERDIEYLEPFANCQNRQPARKRFLHGLKFPAVAFRIDVLVQHRRIGNVLTQKFR